LPDLAGAVSKTLVWYSVDIVAYKEQEVKENLLHYSKFFLLEHPYPCFFTCFDVPAGVMWISDSGAPSESVVIPGPGRDFFVARFSAFDFAQGRRLFALRMTDGWVLDG
jgi:hypothetical protein